MDLDRHFYLYAKGHYYKGDRLDSYLIDDLRKIVGYRCNYNADLASIDDILRILLRLAYKHINHEYKFLDFIKSVTWMYPGSYDNQPLVSDNDKLKVKVIRACLSTIATAKISDIGFELGEKDPKLFKSIEKATIKNKNQ